MIQVDRRTVQQILGSLMAKPELLSDTDKYQIEVGDFIQQLDKFVFSAIYNLYCGGAEKIHTVDIENYLRGNELAKTTFEKENGVQYLQDCEVYCEPSNFNYYYKKLKKINLVRDLQKTGRDMSSIYSENPLNPKHIEINQRFENLTTDDIINKLKGELAGYENKYVLNSVVEESRAYDGIRELIKELKIKPEVGIKLQGEIFNTITRGGRKGTLYLRSLQSGKGKTRLSVGDACQIAYPIRYDNLTGMWSPTGPCEKVLYIMTEQDPAEIQTMVLAYLTGLNEDIFLYGTYKEEHMERIGKAMDIMERYKDNLLFARIPDPCSSIVKNLFRRYNLQYGVTNFFYDYIFSSPAMLNEYRDLGIQEFVALRLFTTTLKNLAVELNSFIMTSTQISDQENNKTSSWFDQYNIQGSKAIYNLVDFACIISEPTKEELNTIQGFEKQYNLIPNRVINIFKNRRGRWTNVRVWSRHDLGTCRCYDLFITDRNLKVVEDFSIVDFKLSGEEEKELKEICDFYNDWDVGESMAQDVKDIIELEPINDVTEKPQTAQQSLLKQIQDAYDLPEDIDKRLKGKGISDLL